MKRWSFDTVLGLLALLTFTATRLIGLAQYPIFFFTSLTIEAKYNRVENLTLTLPNTETNGLPGIPLAQVLTSGRITWDSSAQFFIDRQPVGLEYLVQPGVRVATLGNVKGGAA